MLITLLGLVTVRTPAKLSALAMQTYILAAIVGLFFLTTAIIIANLIKFEGGANPRDPTKRRIWFWMLLFIAVSSSFLYNLFVVAPKIAVNLQNKFITVNLISTAITAFAYIAFGFLLSKLFSTRKIGNWF